MKMSGYAIRAVVFMLNTGFANASDDGNMVSSLSTLSKKTASITAQVSNQTTEAKAAMETYAEKKDEIVSNLNQSIDGVKQQIEQLNPAQLKVYFNQYTQLIGEKQTEIAVAKTALKELSWFKKLGPQGRELKSQLAQHTQQLSTLKEQYNLYADKLKMLGVDLSAYGL